MKRLNTFCSSEEPIPSDRTQGSSVTAFLPTSSARGVQVSEPAGWAPQLQGFLWTQP